MKRVILIAAGLSVGMSLAGWRGRFDEQFAASKVSTPIPAVAWYKLDGNALDSSGNGYDGTWAGTEAYATGKFAGTQAGSFTGTNYIIGPTDSRLAPITITITAWINPSFVTYDRIIITKNKSGGFMLRTRNLGVADFSVAGNYNRCYTSTYAVNSFEWTHLAAKYIGTNATIYVNGVVSATGYSGTINGGGGNLFIGISPDKSAPYSGLVQDIRIYDRALSAANIQRIMTGQTVEPIEELQ